MGSPLHAFVMEWWKRAERVQGVYVLRRPKDEAKHKLVPTLVRNETVRDVALRTNVARVLELKGTTPEAFLDWVHADASRLRAFTDALDKGRQHLVAKIWRHGTQALYAKNSDASEYDRKVYVPRANRRPDTVYPRPSSMPKGAARDAHSSRSKDAHS